MLQLFWVCLGGALGSGARYLVSVGLPRLLGIGFPYATLAVNLVGSFLISFIMQLSLNSQALSPSTRLFLTTGVMGGLTTYSTFNYETLKYLQEEAWFLAALNILSTLLLCVSAGVFGIFCAKWVLKM